MAPSISQKLRALTVLQGRRLHAQKRRKVLCFAGLFTLSAMLAQIQPYIDKFPMYTSILTGKGWIDELLIGHPVRFHNALGMSKYVFRQLLNKLQQCGLESSRFVTATEKLAMFLVLARKGMSTRDLQERFQRSPDTISKYIHEVLDIIVSHRFYPVYVHLPPPQTPEKIRKDRRLSPFFDHVIGAIDCCHIEAFVPDDAVGRYRNRKGVLSQNILVGCDFDLRFTYVLSGWEGSAADSTIYTNARLVDFRVPDGKVYLADAGFPLCKTLLTPFRGTRYHIKEWGVARQKPRDAKELFNLRHAQARNVIERIFGIFKRRFRLLTIAPEYNMETQAKFPPALAALHNFIRLHDPDDEDNLDGGDVQPVRHVEPTADTLGELGVASLSAAERSEASDERDRIAAAMWRSYQDELLRRQ